MEWKKVEANEEIEGSVWCFVYLYIRRNKKIQAHACARRVKMAFRARAGDASFSKILLFFSSKKIHTELRVDYLSIDAAMQPTQENLPTTTLEKKE